MCHPKTLASHGHLAVQSCDQCETISLSFGPMTLRLDRQALEALQLVINQAITRLTAKAQNPSSDKATVVH